MIGVLFAGAACAVEPPGYGDLYIAVLEHARQDLGLGEPIVIHPLMGRLNRVGPGDGPPINHFNDMDTEVIRGAIGQDSVYTICDIGSSGFCEVGPGEVSIVLSEVHDLGPDGDGVVIAVDDRRGQSGTQFYTVRLKHGMRGWKVVEFAPASRPLLPPLFGDPDP